MSTETTYKGGCHCGKVAYTVAMDLENTLVCNCSHCHKKGFILKFVDKEKFTLEKGREMLSEYYFNKNAIRHLFCKECGVESFAEGVAMPKVAINVRCIPEIDTDGLKPNKYNGKDV